MKPRSSGWTPIRETAAEWLERIGYCFHAPTCNDSAVCRAKRAKEKPAATVFKGDPQKVRKIDWEQ